MPSQVTECDWLQKLCQGEDEGYRIFFEEYYQILGLFAFKYVKDKDTAEDIINDIILELYSRKLQFENIVALKTYLFLSIKNRSLNYLRHHQSTQRYLSLTEAEEERDFFLDNIIEEEVYFLLKKAICKLPEPIRQIYELSLQGLSNEEIARQLDLTIDSVKAYKKRGKQVLKKRLKGLMVFLSIAL